MSVLRFFKKKRAGDVLFQKKIRKIIQKSGFAIRGGSGPTPVPRGGCGAEAPTLAARLKRGHQLPWDLLQYSPLYAASSPGSPLPHLLDGHRKLVVDKNILQHFQRWAGLYPQAESSG